MLSGGFKAIAMAALLTMGNAHFFINFPPTIPGAGVKAPLDASGSDFPCHGADITQGPATQLQAGSNYPLGFELGPAHDNTAVHGGGSCQIALTAETDPAKLKDPANWKVIKSFIGGCPTDAKGNLPSAVMCPQNYPQCVNNLNFSLPMEVGTGQFTLIWSWQNSVGNREQYTSCSRVSISGGQDKMSELPGLTIANLAAINSCKSTENTIFDYPNPGKYVEYGVQNYPLKAPVGCDVAASSPAIAAAGASSDPVVSSAPVGSSTPVGSSAPVNSAPAPASPSTQPAVPAPAPAPFANTSTASAPATGCANPCSPDGAVICIGASQFGLCDHGCAVAQPLAAGTTCSGGVIIKRGIKSIPKIFSA